MIGKEFHNEIVKNGNIIIGKSQNVDISIP